MSRKDGRDRTAYYQQYYQDNPTYFRDAKRKRGQEIKAFVQQQKVGLSCKRCGISDARVLDFHHLDKSSKDRGLSYAYSQGWSNERIVREIAKCEVLCANCHRILHWEERQ
jgi:hypothetical protein